MEQTHTEQSVIERIVYQCERGHNILIAAHHEDWRCRHGVAVGGHNEPCDAPVYEIRLREESRQQIGGRRS